MNTEPKSLEQALSGLLRKMAPATAEQLAAIEREKREAMQRRIQQIREAARAPKRQWTHTQLDRSGEWGATEAKLRERVGTGFLLALVGTRGNGKTQLATELIRYATAQLRSSLYATVTEFFMDIKASYRKEATEDERAVMVRYRKPSLLILDEAGRRSETAWEDRLIFELIDKRYADMKDTLLLSNQTVAEFTESLGPSVASRINETGGIIECLWKSHR